MAFYRIYPSKDTSIANGDPSVLTKDISGSNVGASEILNLYRTVDEYNTQANVLMQFDLSVIPGAALASGPDFWLRICDACHAETVPTEFNAIVYQSAQAWQEGAGHDMDYYTDLGAANWASASVSAAWSVSGGVTGANHEMRFGIPFPVPFFNELTSSAYFYTGNEDLNVNVFRIVEDWIDHGGNNGFLIMIDPALTSTDYYIKKFHSRQTHFPTKRPYLEVRWAEPTSTLATVSYFVVTSGDYSGTVWPVSMAAHATGVIETRFSSTVDPTGALVAVIPNLKPVYDATEVPVLQLQCQLKDWNPATALTASSVTPNVVLTNAYIRVTDVVTDEVLVPFDTGSITPYTKLGYSDAGDYFKMYMNSLPTGSLLQLDFIYEAPTGSGNWTLLPGTANRFRVISNG